MTNTTSQVRNYPIFVCLHGCTIACHLTNIWSGRNIFRGNAQDDDHAKLDDLVWMSDLAFLFDFTAVLSAVSLQLQGNSKPITEWIGAIAA